MLFCSCFTLKMSKTLSLRIERIGIVKFGDEKAMGKPYGSLLALGGDYKKERSKLFSRACYGRIRDKGFKIKEVLFR